MPQIARSEANDGDTAQPSRTRHGPRSEITKDRARAWRPNLPPQRQRAAAANQRERAVLINGCGVGHVASSASLRLTAMVNGRFAERINSMILTTSGSPEYSPAALSTRVRNSPLPKNKA